ncbi:MAG: type II secretion system protein [Planctomycetota bacterium]|jgi:competence protein ComGC
MYFRLQVRRRRRNSGGASAFSLVELLTVVFIIALLIGIIIPSLNSARNSAKRSKTQANIKGLETGLELFRNDNEREFPQTGGYPPSFSHPPIRGATFAAENGEFPFAVDTSPLPVAMGAHWLPFMMMGLDQRGFISRKNVPRDELDEPSTWYDPDREETLPRNPFYIEPGAIKTLHSHDLRGRPNLALTNTWDSTQELQTFVDAFDQPILYYAANKFGRDNMVEKLHSNDNTYEDGPPVYFHQDNALFTGSDDEPEGWDFGGGANHKIAFSGADLEVTQLMDQVNEDTFARFIMDRQLEKALFEEMEEGNISDNRKIYPANKSTYILMSAGVDGLYGNSDDIVNFPTSIE